MKDSRERPRRHSSESTAADMETLIIALADVVVLAWLFVRVGRDEIKRDDYAMELQRRKLEDFQNDERRAGRFPGHPDTAFTNLRGSI